MAKLVILHPLPYETVHTFLAAQGKGHAGLGDLSGKILDANGQQVPCTVRTLKRPPFWLIVFEKIPTGKNYRLQTLDHQGAILAQTPIDVANNYADPNIYYPCQGRRSARTCIPTGIRLDPASRETSPVPARTPNRAP